MKRERPEIAESSRGVAVRSKSRLGGGKVSEKNLPGAQVGRSAPNLANGRYLGYRQAKEELQQPGKSEEGVKTTGASIRAPRVIKKAQVLIGKGI